MRGGHIAVSAVSWLLSITTLAICADCLNRKPDNTNNLIKLLFTLNLVFAVILFGILHHYGDLDRYLLNYMCLHLLLCLPFVRGMDVSESQQEESLVIGLSISVLYTLGTLSWWIYQYMH